MQKPMYYFGMAMGVVYVLFGIFFVVWGVKFTDPSPSWLYIGLGGLFIVYGIFRFFRYRTNN